MKLMVTNVIYHHLKLTELYDKYTPLVAVIISSNTQFKHLAISFNDRILFIQQPCKIKKKNH